MRVNQLSKLIVINGVSSVAFYFLVRYYAGSNLFSYPLHRLLHISGAVVYLGNIVFTGMWMLRAELSGLPAAIYFASMTVSRFDTYFTKPGVLFVAVNGVLLAATRQGGPYKTGWIASSLVLFSLAGVIWVVFLSRYQRELGELSQKLMETAEKPSKEFIQTLHRWYCWGVIAIILSLFALVLMILKPHVS